MLLVKYVIAVCLMLCVQYGIAESDEIMEEVSDEELDEEFIEILGALETQDGEWFDIFLSTIDEAEEEQTAEAYE